MSGASIGHPLARCLRSPFNRWPPKLRLKSGMMRYPASNDLGGQIPGPVGKNPRTLREDPPASNYRPLALETRAENTQDTIPMLAANQACLLRSTR